MCWTSQLTLDPTVSTCWVQNIRLELQQHYSSSDLSHGSLEAGAHLTGDGSVWILAPALWDRRVEDGDDGGVRTGEDRRTGGQEGRIGAHSVTDV